MRAAAGSQAGRVIESVGAGAVTALLLSATVLAAGCGGADQLTTSTTSAAASPVARGHVLYVQDGCSGCHSLDGSRLIGPTWKGLAGSRVQLNGGRSVIADNTYLTRHIVEPQAVTVTGYPGEVMAQATAPLELRKRPQQVQALVAFIDSLR